MSGRSYTFTNALVRLPSHSIVDGLRANDLGVPDINLFRHHHARYVELLESTGAAVEVLPSLEAYPDSVFVEDTALCLPEGVVTMRPGAPSRLGEVDEIQPKLKDYYEHVKSIEGPGFIEGGDILATENEILVGRSARTDTAGIAELSNLVDEWGYQVREVETPDSVLHFKTDCSLLDEETVLSTHRLAASGCFSDYRIINTAEGEEACANAIRFNNLVIIPDGFPKTAEILDSAGYEIKTIGNTEAAKIDGGMSCLSLRFSPAATR